VEDNEANRELGTIILESSGQKVLVAENGLRALEHLCEKTFDVILMDVQMPEMDGITATRVIRAMERGSEPDVKLSGQLLGRLGKKISGKYIPIIAMTAHAMDSDRNRCLNAGMDAYLTKPFQPEQVMEALQKFAATGNQVLPEDDMEIERADKEQGNSTGAKESIIETVKHHLANTYTLNPDQVRQMLSTSAASMTVHLDKVKQGLKDDDFMAVCTAAHALKGNLLNLGLARCAELAKRMEESAAKNEYISYDKYLVELRTTLDEILSQNADN
jgi:CheY-like chemotaxis protein/HPt (histidine-containing phosphotransfer) domain-containing protein